MNIKANNFESAPVASCYDGGYIAHMDSNELALLSEALLVYMDKGMPSGKYVKLARMDHKICSALRADNIIE